jgi:hypothetical protein
MALTTNSRVYHKAGLSSNDIVSTDVDEFIEDAQAIIEGKAGRTFAVADSDYKLARGACTDLAAAYCLIRVLGGEASGLAFKEANLDLDSQQESKVQLVKQYLAQVKDALEILKPQRSSLRPKASTS